ncbi:MAG: hypothetical protein INH02_06280 [Gemmatimonas sp.]|uniref:hypothetical protein n=1 Tax=Gemmatimonas sp. TaxID=1962908 RepID=UPI0025C2843E|nr:hypothetical protein [Gemmatimonas sp.]MCA2987011.1 hypothetical protein [Gemmatimonas sp.]
MFLQSAVRTITTAALLFAAPAVQAQPLPPAADVLAKHVAAIGGRDAIMKITSMKQVGAMEITAAGMTADLEMYVMAPNKQSMKMSLAGLGEILSGTDGTVAWSVNPMQGARLLEGKELTQAKEQADFVASMLYSPDRFSAMTNEGVVDFAGEKAYKIKLVRKDTGNESWNYFSLASGLQIGAEATLDSEMGKMSTSSIIADYKQFGPLKVATRTEMTTGPQKMILTVKSAEFNTVTNEAVAVPAAVQPLIKK